MVGLFRGFFRFYEHRNRQHRSYALPTHGLDNPPAAVYFLILVGARVCTAGAGMGCLDWPTCFSSSVLPTSEAQLPANYQEIYAELGYSDTRFNVVKTWTEYANRLVGVSIGLLIFLTAIYSWSCRTHG